MDNRTVVVLRHFARTEAARLQQKARKKSVITQAAGCKQKSRLNELTCFPTIFTPFKL